MNDDLIDATLLWLARGVDLEVAAARIGSAIARLKGAELVGLAALIHPVPTAEQWEGAQVAALGLLSCLGEL